MPRRNDAGAAEGNHHGPEQAHHAARGSAGRRPRGNRRLSRTADGQQGRSALCLHLRQGGIRQRGTSKGAASVSAAVLGYKFRSKKADLTLLSDFFAAFPRTLFSNVCAPAATAF